MKHLVIATTIAIATTPLVVAFPQQPQTPTFRGGAVLIPIDVRVVDKKGEPIKGLTAADFTVLENGVKQDVQHFESHTFNADPSVPVGHLVRTDPSSSEVPPPPTRRVFLLVLGRGRLQYPSRGVDASLDFVRNNLLPQDMIAVSAWNRATDFTNDHAQILKVLEEFKKRHEAIEGKLKFGFSGLAAVYGNPNDLGGVQKDIDAVFAPAGANARQATSADATAMQQRIAGQTRQSLADTVAGAETDSRARFEIPLDMSFDEFAPKSVATMQDLGRLLSGIEYLRGIEGEKHLVLISENGLYLPSADDDRGLAAIASDARVVIDTIQTGGVQMPDMQVVAGPANGQRQLQVSPRFIDTMAVMTLRTVAELTGGRASSYAYAKDAYDNINRSTSSGYVLGYYPKNQNWDGKYRRIKVTVNRDGATVMFRHGYYATNERGFDRRGALSYTRIVTALAGFADVKDVPFTVSISSSSNLMMDAQVKVAIPPAKVALAPGSGQRTASLDVAVFCADAQGKQVAESWETITLTVSDADFAQLTNEKTATYTAKMLTTGKVKYVRVAVYDRRADRVGTTMITIQDR